MAGLSRQDSITKYGSDRYTGWAPTEAQNDFVATGSNRGNMTLQSDAYNQAVQPAINTLQQGTSTVANAYQKALDAITQQSNLAGSTAQRNEGALLASRGINANAPGFGQQEMAAAQQSAQIPYNTAIANTGVQEAGALQGILGNIANLQAGGVPYAVQTPGQSAQTALTLAQAGQVGTQAQYIPTNFGVFNLATGNFVPYTSTSSVPSTNTNFSVGNNSYTYVP